LLASIDYNINQNVCHLFMIRYTRNIPVANISNAVRSRIINIDCSSLLTRMITRTATIAKMIPTKIQIKLPETSDA
jgi:hypothetical protein